MSLTTSIKHSRLLADVARRDGALFDLICARRTAALSFLMIRVTRSGDAGSYIAIAFAGLLIGGAGGETLVKVAAAAGLATAIAYIPKRLIARPRPTRASALRVALLDPPDAWSFPSSHTAAAVAAACAVAATLGPIAFLPVLFWALAVGISRIYVGAHYPLDVVIGGLLGAAVAFSFA